MMNETVMVTGASGFIGSHVVRRLLAEKSRKVVAVTRKSEEDCRVKEMAENGAFLVQGNFCDPSILKRIFGNHRIQAVIHLAALRGAGNGKWADYEEVNVLGTQRLLEEACSHGVKKFIFCSSVGVHGTIPQELPATAKTPFLGDNDYHISKIMAEREVMKSISQGFNALILRPTITYGPGDTGFPKTLVHLVKNKRLLLPSREVKIHLLDVMGFSRLIDRALTNTFPSQRIFFVADSEPVSLHKLTDLIHLFYFQTTYPSHLRLPQFFFSLLSRIVQLAKNEKWATRIKLISRSWFYDLQPTVDQFDYLPSRTCESFIEFMSQG